MFRRWLDEPARRQLAESVSYIESMSAVEVVVIVRRRTQAWPHVAVAIGLLAAWAALAFMLYGSPAFPLWSFLVDPFVLGAIAGWVATLSPSPIRWFTSAPVRRKAVHRAANDAFIERRIHATRGRTGLLVFCALGERMAAVIADTGVTAAVSPARLEAWRDQIERSMTAGGSATASAIAAMAPVFASALPRPADDMNELADPVARDIQGSIWA